MTLDYTKLLKKLDKDPNGEDPGLRLRTATIDAVNADGTVDILLSGGLVPSVPVLEGAVVADNATVQVLVARGSLLVLGGAGGGALEKVTAYNGDNPSTTSTSFTAFTTTAIHGVVFVAPASGAIKVSLMGWLGISSTNLRCRAYMSAQIRAGAVINSGTIFDAANDSAAVIHENESTGGFAYEFPHIDYVLTGLTPGAVYNAVSMVRCDSSPVVTVGAAVNKRRILIEPW